MKTNRPCRRPSQTAKSLIPHLAAALKNAVALCHEIAKTTDCDCDQKKESGLECASCAARHEARGMKYTLDTYCDAVEGDMGSNATDAAEALYGDAVALWGNGTDYFDIDDADTSGE